MQASKPDTKEVHAAHRDVGGDRNGRVDLGRGRRIFERAVRGVNLPVAADIPVCLLALMMR